MRDLNAQVSIFLRVIDTRELIAAGRRWLIENGVAESDAEAAGIIDDDDYSKALRYLIDPGISPPGTEIQDSNCELY